MTRHEARRYLLPALALSLLLLDAPAVATKAHAAGLVVNTLADADPPATNGLCSLREAIANANDNAATHPDCPEGAGADTITFSVSGTIVLAAALPDIADPAGLTIDGSGQNVTVSGNNAVRPFAVSTGATAELKVLTVTSGRASGAGGIYNGGTLTLTSSTISGNTASDLYGSGGGIYNNLDAVATVTSSTIIGNTALGLGGGGIFNSNGGTLTITGSTLSGNSAPVGFGGGIANERGTLSIGTSTLSGNTAEFSGGINNQGALTVTSSTLSGNHATGGYGGGILKTDVGAVSVTNSNISGNTASSSGGGIYNTGSGTLTVTNSTISGNTAHSGGGIHSQISGGGALTVSGSTISTNTASMLGGGISNSGSTVTVVGSTIINNGSSYGGGVYNTGSGVLTVTDSAVSGNSATYGGGIRNSSGIVTVTGSTTNSNTALWGGGIANEGGVVTVTNSTLSGNNADHGGGVNNDNGTVEITHSTVSNNAATGSGGGVRASGGVLSLEGSILSGNGGSSGPNCGGGSITLTGPNLISDPSGCIVTGTPPITGAPKLGLLADNGGPTWTHALLPGSPAIDAGDDAVCAAAPVSGKDQRGIARPQGTHCDLGSFEKEPPFVPVGGRNLRITTGSIDLSWDGGTAQTGYYLLRYNTDTTAADLIPLAGNLTSYSDAAAVNGTVYCYVLAAMNGGSVLGLSDLLCGLTGISSGTAVPGGFALALNQTASATMTWTPPAGGVGSYLLQRIPLDGTPISSVPLGAGVTSTTQSVTSAGTCFQLIAYRVLEFGTSNVFCGVPGVSSLGATHLKTLAELSDTIRDRLAGLSLSAGSGRQGQARARRHSPWPTTNTCCKFAAAAQPHQADGRTSSGVTVSGGLSYAFFANPEAIKDQP